MDDLTPDQVMTLANFLRGEQERAFDTSLNDKRATALDFYQGQPFGDEVEGRSQAVTRDVSEVIDFLVVGILGTIISSGKVVEFETEPEPVDDPEAQPGPDGSLPKPKMVDYGEQATAAVHYHFMRKQPGYRILHDALKAGLLEKSGVVKTYVEQVEPLRQERMVLAGEIEDGPDGPMHEGASVISAEATDEGWQPGMEAQNWRIVVEIPQAPNFCDVNVPNEYFRVAADATDLDGSIYVGDRAPKTLSDLVKLGYDREELSEVWGSAPDDTIVEQSRDAERSQDRNTVGQRNGSNKTLWLEEEYPLYDLADDGLSERLFVHRIGNRILKAMPVDEQPYSLWSPFPMQHRLIGQSAADKTMDIQRIRSVLLRQGLDSMYLSNSPRTLIDETSITIDTIDDLLTVRPGGLVRYKGTPPTPLEQRDTSDTAFSGMEMMITERESRTGVTRQSQGMNPDTMNDTAFALAKNIQSAQQIELYITRNFVEFLVMPLFAKRYRLMRKYGRPFRMKVEGKYVEIDPRKWPADIDMSITVGLGTGNKDQRLSYRLQLLEIQKEGAMAGSRLFPEEKIYQNVKRLIDDSGLGAASDYIVDPSELPPAEPQPDPATLEAQAKAQQAQQNAQNAHDQAMARLQLQQEEQQANAALKERATDLDLQLKRDAAEQSARLAEAKASEEARIAEQAQVFEMQMEVRRFEFDQEMARKKHDLVAVEGGEISRNRPGGSLAE